MVICNEFVTNGDHFRAFLALKTQGIGIVYYLENSRGHSRAFLDDGYDNKELYAT